MLVGRGHANERLQEAWMSQWSVNGVTEGDLFSAILFISCDFFSFQLVLIKKKKKKKDEKAVSRGKRGEESQQIIRT